MAKFTKLTSDRLTYFVNLDTVRFIQPLASGKTMLKFDDEHSITINEDANAILNGTHDV